MRRVFCDGCGVELAAGTESCLTAVGDLDLCDTCITLYEGLDLREVILGALQARAQEQPPVASPAVDDLPPPPMRGRYAPVKRQILAALEAYRQEHGLTHLGPLAKKAGVGLEPLKAILRRERQPNEVWRSVGRALGIDWPGEEGA